MGWMIRNDGKAFEVDDRVILKGGGKAQDDMSALIWLYDHTRDILVRYFVLRLLVLTARKDNPYISPPEYYRGLSADDKGLVAMKVWLAEHVGLLDAADRELLRNDESIMDNYRLPLNYSDEISYRRKTLSYQLDQEFLYAEEHRRNDKRNRQVNIVDDSVLFDWSDIIEEFLMQLGSDYDVRISRFGSGYEYVDRGSHSSGQKTKKNDPFRKPEEQLRSGRSLLQILCETPYSQDRILQRIEWIRRQQIDAFAILL